MRKNTRLELKAIFKNVDYRHYICIAITVGFVLISAFVFPYAVPRLIEAFRDFGLSIAYHYTELFGFSDMIAPSVTSYSKMPFIFSGNFPATWEEFKLRFTSYWQAFANGQNVLNYISSMRKGALVFSFVLSMLTPLVVVLLFVIRYLLSKQNVRYNEDTKPLRMFKKLSNKTYRPAKAWVESFIDFVKEYKLYFPAKKLKPGDVPQEPSGVAYWELWAFIWLLSFNAFTVVFEALAYYFYFFASFDVLSIYTQVYKFLLDLSVMIKFVPVPVWVLVGLIIINALRKKIGYDRLNHHELINRGFMNERGVFSLIVAPMRQGKTKLLVSMALSRSVMFRDMAYEIILRCDLKFPYFPWINFERSLRYAMDTGAVINLATCRRFVHSKMCKFNKHKQKRYIFGYDFARYGMSYDNAKYIETLEEVLTAYAQAYFIYIVQSSLLVTNFSIREDSIIEDIGNFPRWHDDFFKTDSRLIEAVSRLSHIIDYEALRLGKKLLRESKFAFEFGVIDITEIAKERGNMLELQGIKKEDKETNQKNDGFDDWVKMCGHSATVDFTCFVSIYADDQREDNLSAGLREVGEIIRIEDVEKGKLTMPLFFIGELVYAISHKIIASLHKKERFNKGNNTLLYYILHTVCAKIESYYMRIYNTFGYELMHVSIQDGAKNNEAKLHKYFISNKKDLSKRYATDCLADSLAVRALRATWGLDDLPTYKTVRATHDENKQQKSFFIQRISEYMDETKKTHNPNSDKRMDEARLKRFFEGKRW